MCSRLEERRGREGGREGGGGRRGGRGGRVDIMCASKREKEGVVEGGRKGERKRPNHVLSLSLYGGSREGGSEQ